MELKNKLNIVILGLAIYSLGCNQDSFHSVMVQNPLSVPSQVFTRQYKIPSQMGAIIWSGQITNAAPGRRLPAGVDQLAARGFQTVKLVLGPTSYQSGIYDIPNPNCSASDLLKCTVETQAFVDALSDPRILNVVFVTYDAITAGLDGSSRNFMNSSFMQTRQASIVSSYQNLGLSLMRKYRGTGKTFIIENWESDNSAYCGSTYAFLNDFPNNPVVGQSFRTWCLANYLSTYGVANPAASIDGLKFWFSLRQSGLQAARAQAQVEGITGVTLKSGIEFNSVNFIKSIGYPSVLFDVIPQVGFDVAAYSAYESVNSGNLLNDFPSIEAQVGGKEIMISEYGFSTHDFPNGLAEQNLISTTLQIESLQAQNRLTLATVWQAYSDGSISDFGLFDNSSNPSTLFSAFLRAFPNL